MRSTESGLAIAEESTLKSRQEWQATIAANPALLQNPELQEWQTAYLNSDRVIDKLTAEQLTIEHAIKETSEAAIRRTLAPDWSYTYNNRDPYIEASYSRIAFEENLRLEQLQFEQAVAKNPELFQHPALQKWQRQREIERQQESPRLEALQTAYRKAREEAGRTVIPEFLKEAIRMGYNPRELGYVNFEQVVVFKEEVYRSEDSWFTEHHLRALQRGRKLEEIRFLDPGRAEWMWRSEDSLTRQALENMGQNEILEKIEISREKDGVEKSDIRFRSHDPKGSKGSDIQYRYEYDVERYNAKEPSEFPDSEHALGCGFSKEDLTQPWMSQNHISGVISKILRVDQARVLTGEQIIAVVEFGVPLKTVSEYPFLTLAHIHAMEHGFSFDALKGKPINHDAQIALLRKGYSIDLVSKITPEGYEKLQNNGAFRPTEQGITPLKFLLSRNIPLETIVNFSAEELLATFEENISTIKPAALSPEANGTLIWQYQPDSMTGRSSSNPGSTKTEHPKAKP